MAIEILHPAETLEVKLAAAARAIFDVLGNKTGTGPLVVALCGGRSVVGLLKALLAESAKQPKELLRRVHFFMVDERIAPLDHADSNFGGLNQQFFATLVEQGTISKDQLHPLSIATSSAQSDCQCYMQELERVGGHFDVVVVGMGEDGHIAGLFPHHQALAQRGRSFIPFFDSPKPPPERVTASRELVTTASLGVLLALGEAKRAAWNSFLSRSVTVEECPAKMVEAMERCVVVSDLV
jgi:6-phosphogluconolactonase